MKPTAILINTARGGDRRPGRRSREALHTGQIGGAALDVTDPEPLPPDDPLWQAPNLLVVPHIGSATWTARERMAEIAVDNILAGLDGKPLPYQVPAQTSLRRQGRACGSRSSTSGPTRPGSTSPTSTDGEVTAELTRISRVTRLGAGVDASGRLADDALAREYAVLDEYHGML